MSVRRIIQTFDRWRALGEPMVLATVYDTLGSTYSKAGHRILIAANGDYQGLVSGGCLEGDLAERARKVLANGEAQAVTYDLRDEADELFGLGVGCNGLIRVLLQPLLPTEQYEPFASIARQLLGRNRASIATVVDSSRSGVSPGASLLLASGEPHVWGLDSETAAELIEGCRRAIVSDEARFAADEHGLAVLYAPLKPVPRLLVLGGGLDAVPMVNMSSDLGWRVTVADHRPAYLERGGFTGAERALLIDPRRLREQVAVGEFDAIVIMSHHLATDRTYLRELAEVETAYIGVLGPRARKLRLLEDLAEEGVRLRMELRGPVGIDIGADSPESIALSVLAEINAVLAAAVAAPPAA
jgi:xanthine/CO dehydrogenase XdhC/CoxF family maturation factor